MSSGIIADIQRASIHDGPGIRTTVFLKGCPLHCAWCHNPECIDFKPQMMFYPEKCIGCGQCEKGCFSGARTVCGRKMSVDEVLKEIIQDREYYGTNGGVTFSGGEPMAQPDFLYELIMACKQEGIHCAVETSLYYFREEILKELDLVMADLKIWDDELHKRYTGVGNDRIKENFRKVNKMGIPVLARTPLIPEIDQGIDKIASFLKKLEYVGQYEILPYHPLGESKREAMGLQKTEFTIPSAEYRKEQEKYVFIRRTPAGNAGNQDSAYT